MAKSCSKARKKLATVCACNGQQETDVLAMHAKLSGEKALQRGVQGNVHF